MRLWKINLLISTLFSLLLNFIYKLSFGSFDWIDFFLTIILSVFLFPFVFKSYRYILLIFKCEKVDSYYTIKFWTRYTFLLVGVLLFFASGISSYQFLFQNESEETPIRPETNNASFNISPSSGDEKKELSEINHIILGIDISGSMKDGTDIDSLRKIVFRLSDNLVRKFRNVDIYTFGDTYNKILNISEINDLQFDDDNSYLNTFIKHVDSCANHKINQFVILFTDFSIYVENKKRKQEEANEVASLEFARIASRLRINNSKFISPQYTKWNVNQLLAETTSNKIITFNSYSDSAIQDLSMSIEKFITAEGDFNNNQANPKNNNNKTHTSFRNSNTKLLISTLFCSLFAYWIAFLYSHDKIKYIIKSLPHSIIYETESDLRKSINYIYDSENNSITPISCYQGEECSYIIFIISDHDLIGKKVYYEECKTNLSLTRNIDGKCLIFIPPQECVEGKILVINKYFAKYSKIKQPSLHLLDSRYRDKLLKLFNYEE